MTFQEEFSIIIVVFSTLINLIITVLVYSRNPKSYTHKVFSLLGLSILFWLILNHLSYGSWSEDIALLLIRASTFFAPLICLFFFLLAYSFPASKGNINKKSLILLSLVTGLVMLSIISPYAFVSTTIINNFPNPSPGYGIIPFVTYVVTMISAAIFILFKRIKNNTGIEKQQIRIVMLGVLLMPGLIIVTNVIPVVLFNNNSLVPLTPLYPLIFEILTAYAIIRHRLLDIRLLVVRAIVFALILLFISLVYMAILFGLTFFFTTGVEVNLQEVLFTVIFALFFAATFQPLRRVFEKYTDKVFYKDHYDSNSLLWDSSKIMTSTLRLSNLVESLINNLADTMHINYISAVVIRKSAIVWVKSSKHGSSKPVRTNDMHELITASFKSGEHILIFEEMPEGKQKNIMRDNDITIVLPLVLRKELIGGFILGPKSSGEIYSSEDVSVLKIIAPEAAIAIKNAFSYEEIKRFNVTLKSEIEKATEKLRKANSRLKELDKLKDEFVSIASHELRTPMTAIKSYLWMAMNRSNQEVKEPMKKYLDISYKSTERLISLVNDMLTVSRIERNKIEIKKEDVDIVNVGQLVFDELSITAKEKNIKFEYHHPEKEKLIVFGDKDKLREIIQNLVGNALKFTPENGEISLDVDKHKSKVKFAVKDTASGIPKDQMENLFKKFSRIDYSYSKHSSQPGTGLGLYISKKIANLHNGDIDVESKVGKGSTFTLILPLKVEMKQEHDKT